MFLLEYLFARSRGRVCTCSVAGSDVRSGRILGGASYGEAFGYPIRCHCGGPAPGPGRKLEVQSRQNEAGEQDEEMSFNEMEISPCGLKPSQAGSRPRLEASAVEFRKTRHMVNVGGNAQDVLAGKVGREKPAKARCGGDVDGVGALGYKEGHALE